MEKGQKNVMAITGFVLSLVSLLINPIAIISILGAVFSGIGLSKVKTLESGKGLAIAGIIISVISIIWFIVAFFLAASMLASYY